MSSGAPVEQGVAESMINVVEHGTHKYKEFVSKRLESGNKQLFAPIPRSQLKTFRDSNKKSKVTAKGKIKEMVFERDILGKLLALSNKHNSPVDIHKLLTYSLAPVPLCLSNADGTRRTPAKSKLFDIIVEYCNVVEPTEYSKNR